MRRILSITTVLALVLSSFLPVMASTGGMAAQAMSCHGGVMPHCDRATHGHHHHDAAASESDPSFSVVEDNGKCPMDCCAPGHPTTGAAPVTASFLPPLAVTDRSFHFVSITFISAGFSSHTDRGPPLA
jgi:hypothetical protein